MKTTLITTALSVTLLGSALFGAPAAQEPSDVARPEVGQAALTAAQDKPARNVSKYNLGKGKLAIQGYDPVAYFPEGGGKPMKGVAKLEHKHQGVVYRFASEKTLGLFKKNPGKYEPQYGGWCAYAMASGEQVEIDPKSFHIADGKLTLFFKSFFNDTRKKWLKDPGKLRPKADKAWTGILKAK